MGEIKNMEAPNKIYINPDLDCPWTGEGVTGDVEYIRKEVLMKWIEDSWKESYGVTWEGLVKKIESL